jgi:hypothetical protein
MMDHPADEILTMSAEEAYACEAEFLAMDRRPLPTMEPGDTFKYWSRDRETATYKRLLDKLHHLRYRRPVVVVRFVQPDYIHEAHLYMDAWVELWDCTGDLHGVRPYCFKSYHHV